LERSVEANDEIAGMNAETGAMNDEISPWNDETATNGLYLHH
jgi:hypothetical protein